MNFKPPLPAFPSLNGPFPAIPAIMQIVLYVLAIGVMWTRMGNAVELKADKTEVQAVKVDVIQKADRGDVLRIQSDVSAILSLVCQNKPHDSLCRKNP